MALTQISTAGVKDDAVTSGKIPANAVGSSELADNAVDTAAIVNNAVTTAKISDDNVTFEKIENITANQVLGRVASGTGEIQALSGAHVRSIINVADGANQTTINNNADNRVITGSGTANTLEGESGLTFSSNTLSINTNGSSIAENNVRFQSSGKAYIDHATTGQDIDIRTSVSSSLDTTGITIKSTGNLAFASGKGIDFSATSDTTATGASMTSELLDDYEEGTWTPIINSGFTATYTSNYGTYTKVGRIVYYNFYIQMSNVTGTSSDTNY